MIKQANWIVYPGAPVAPKGKTYALPALIETYNNKAELACPVFTRKFAVKKPVARAVMEISAQGVYSAELNGKRLGYVLAPGCTAYRYRLQYQTIDVTDALTAKNDLRVTVARGWYTGRINWRMRREFNDRAPALIASLVITYRDGTKETIVTDENWDVCYGSQVLSGFYDGEVYDATVADYAKKKAVCRPDPKNVLVKQHGDTIGEQERIAPLAVITTPKGEKVVDFGQNLTGYVEFTVDAKAGDKINFSYAEVLDKEGNFYTENYRQASAKTEYVCRDGLQTHKPALTFYGFRYIRIDDAPASFDPANVTAIVVHSDMKRTGWLDSSDKMLNQLFHNIIWGQKGNFLDIPTDCPQRDERMGWTGDAEVFCRTATYNYDCERFFDKWLADLRLDQYPNGGIPHVVPQFWGDDPSSAAWADAATICPYQVYETYGNREILEKSYDSMKKYLAYIASVTHDADLWTGCGHYGDWLGMDAPAGSYKGSTREDFIASAYYAYSTAIVAKTGKILGYDVSEYEALYARIRAKFIKTYPTLNTQTEHVLALHFGLTDQPEKVAASLAKMIHENGDRLATGFVGTPYLLHALSENGYADLAYTLLLQDKFPSWLYSVKCGATTMWEHWDGKNEDGDFWSKDMNSFNHYAYGSVADWVYGVAAGISPKAPGFASVRVAPIPTDRLDYLSAKLETRYGTVSSKWYHDGNKIRYEITVPVESEIVIDGVSRIVKAGSYLF